jgi:aldehyde dehydrogenase (NAD+)
MNLELEDLYTPFIDNRFVECPDAERFSAVDPATGEVLSRIVCGTKAHIDAAVSAAQRAFPSWAATPPEERSRLLLRLADAVEADSARLAMIDCRDIGRRPAETAFDQAFAVSQYRYFAGALLTFEGVTRPIRNGLFTTRFEPLGVCALIIPWNGPTILTACKLGPALAAGNTVVLKPDENASLSTMELCKKLATILPPGVVNVVPGFGIDVGAYLVRHPGIRKISFTGSTSVGREVAQVGATALIPVTLELGGKSPNIVFPDVEDLDAVVDNTAFACMFGNGQGCLSGTRLFLHADIYTRFLDKLLERLASAKVGAPLDETAKITCLVSEKQGRHVTGLIEAGVNTGATLRIGGARVRVPEASHGWFIEPTVLETTNDNIAARREIFGPVLSVLKWDNFERMIREANDTDYGLASGIYTGSIASALRAADALQAGSVWVNQYFNLASGMPFGGYKQSGLGREMSHDTLRYFSQVKTVVIAADVPQPSYLT